jgi:hypothetical protein
MELLGLLLMVAGFLFGVVAVVMGIALGLEWLEGRTND